MNFLRVTLQSSPGAQKFGAQFALEVPEYFGHIAVHPFDVHLKLLWLTELAPAKVTQWACPLRIHAAAVRSMHLQVVETQEELQKSTTVENTTQNVQTTPNYLLTKLTLVGSLPVVHLFSMLHDVLLAEHRDPTNLTVIFANRQAE